MKIYQCNQYDTLKSCLVCYPVYFEIINKSNEYYKKIDYELLFSQYNNFLNNLTQNDVKLNFLLVCYPVYFEIINKSNEYYKKIDYELLFSQYNNFLNNLTQNDVKLNFLDLNKNSANQLFTQDIGFVIDDVFFISNMKKQERSIETIYLINFIKKNNLKVIYTGYWFCNR